MPLYDSADADLFGAAIVAPLIAPDPGGLIPRAEYAEFYVAPATGVEPSPHSDQVRVPDGYGYPMYGPPATAFTRVDLDSRDWWGIGYETIWPEPTLSTETALFKRVLIPSDLYAKMDAAYEDYSYAGAFPPLSRNPPPSPTVLVEPFDPNVGFTPG
jgi:hypothetical protein